MSDPDRGSVRSQNRRLVMNAAFMPEATSRAEVMRRVGISKATVSRVVEELIREGFVHEGELLEREGRGRRSASLRLSSALGYVVGIDLGLASTRVLAWDLRGQELARHQIESPARTHIDELARHIVGATRNLRRDAGLAGPIRHLSVGVVPGQVGLVDRSPSLPGSDASVDGPALAAAVSHEIGCPVALDTDSNMALMGELAGGGADREAGGPGETAARNVALLTVSSALGAAFAVDGKLLSSNRAAGSIGAIPFKDGEPLSKWLSVRGLLARASELGIAAFAPAALLEPSTKPEQQLRDEVGEALLLITFAVSTILDPDLIVLNGRLKALAVSLLPTIQERMEERLPHVPLLRGSRSDNYLAAHGAAAAALLAARERVLDEVIRVTPQSA